MPDEARGPLRTLLIGAAVACGALALALTGGYLYLAREVPPMESVRDYHPMVASRVVTADGSLVGEFYREKRTVVPMDRIPRVLVQALISAEDKDFYTHPGFNLLAMARAVLVDAVSRRKRLGASTITQQVVKNFFLTPDKRLKRKLKELMLAARLERNLSKDDILYLYLNQINFGKAHYGVEEASLYYFGKHVSEIGLGEAALLAGLPQNPARLNPRKHPENAKRRQIYVLDRMLANGYVTQQQRDAEARAALVLSPPPEEARYGWYLDEVKRQLVARFGQAAVEGAGLTVEVAMDPRLQQAAERAVQEGLRAVDQRQGYRGPLFRIPAARVPDVLAALSRRLSAPAVSLGDGPLLPDLADPGERGRSVPEAVARAARLRSASAARPLAGVVSAVGPREAKVAFAAGLEGTLPLSAMAWARPFKPEGRTAPPREPREALAVGDVVLTRATRLELSADRAGRKRIARLELALDQAPLAQGAFVALDLATRGVLALVGGYRYDPDKSAFNRATQARRQPGSAIKPFLYAAALESRKFTPVTRVDDSPEVIVDPWSGKAWKPQNFEKDEFAGPLTLRRALAASKNTVAVKLLLDLGLDRVRAQAEAAGLESPLPQSYTAALGTGEVGVLELVGAYSTLASLGLRKDPQLIRKVTARDGSVLFAAPAEAVQALRSDTAYVDIDLMRSVIDDEEGTAHSLSSLERPAAGKTGTASEHRDAWFVGFTPQVIAGAWVGFDDHRMLGPAETGGHCAGPIWLSWMREQTQGQPVAPWPAPPPGVVEVKVNRGTGLLARDNDPLAVREVFLAGTEPTAQQASGPADPARFYQDGR